MDEPGAGEEHGSAGEATERETAWHPVCRRSDLPTDGGGFGCEVEGRRVALFLHEGEVHAVDDQCPHEGASLAEGVIRRGEVTCPWHSFHFDLCSGRNADGLAMRIRVHRARVREDGTVEAALGRGSAG